MSSNRDKALVALGATALAATGTAIALHYAANAAGAKGARRPHSRAYSVVVFLVGDGGDADGGKPVGRTIRHPRHASVADLIAAAALALKQDTVR